MARFTFTYELRSAEKLIAEIDGRCEVLDGDLYVDFESIPGGEMVPVPSFMLEDVKLFLQTDPVFSERLAEARGEDRFDRIARDRYTARRFRGSDASAASMLGTEQVFDAIFKAGAAE